MPSENNSELLEPLQKSLKIEEKPDGTLYLSQTTPLPAYPNRITDKLLEYAKMFPEKTLYADRGKNGEWRRLTYLDATSQMRSLGQYLLNAQLSQERPLAILSGNSLEHAILALAALHVGIPYAAISPNYSKLSKDFAQIKNVFATLTPGMVFAQDKQTYSKAIDAISNENLRTIYADGAESPAAESQNAKHDATIATALATVATDEVDAANRKITPETIAKFLFTSGSTGSPKAVINTHRMICANQAMVRETFYFFKDTPPVLLDWAPWHHTAGGNKVFFIPIFNGGTLYIDDGNPSPKHIEKTVRNLKEVAPHWYFNVPAGFAALLPFIESDADLRNNMFKDLKMLWYAGAGMAQHTWDALEKASEDTLGHKVLIATGLGATETAPACLICTWPQKFAGNVGLPMAGITLKLVPSEGKLDARVKGDSITPGYWRAPEISAKAFDEEGFYKFGDALRPADPNDLKEGFFFDGRTAENFKLDTGTWVAAGALRAKFVNFFGDIMLDAAIAGPNRPYLSALVFPNMTKLAQLTGIPENQPDKILAHEEVTALFAENLAKFAKQSTGSSNRIKSIILAAKPPSIDNGELADKGSINQRAVLANRAESVEEIYNGSSRVISI